MNSLINLIRPDLRNFNPYSSARDEAPKGRIWLNANESPYTFELQKGIKINRYPEKQSAKLIGKFAEIFKVKIDQIVLSRGSDEVIDLLIRLFCSEGQDAIITCPPTYGMYSVCARLQGANVIEIPLLSRKNYQLDLSSIMSAWNEKAKIIFLCSPNNPTGNLLNKDDILYLCKQLADKSIIVIDEAYIEFADAVSLSSEINQFNNLAILRTTSKAYGLAGARFGFLLANQELIQWILKIIAPYPLSSVITNMVFDALSSKRLRQIQNQIECIKAEKLRLFAELKTLSFVKRVWPSEANYLLVEMENSEIVMRACAKNGIVLRSMFDKEGLENCIRISIGLPEENSELVRVLQEVT